MKVFEEGALCFEDTQILTSECDGSWFPATDSKCKVVERGASQGAAPRYRGVVERAVKAGPVLAGLELMTQCFVKAKKNTCAQ